MVVLVDGTTTSTSSRVASASDARNFVALASDAMNLVPFFESLSVALAPTTTVGLAFNVSSSLALLVEALDLHNPYVK